MPDEIKRISPCKEKSVIIGGKEYLFKSITLLQLMNILGNDSIYDFFDKDKKTDNSPADFLKRVDVFLEASSGLKLDDLLNCTGEQLQDIYEIFKEVNEVFFGKALGVIQGDLMKMIKANSMIGIQEIISSIIEGLSEFIVNFKEKAMKNAVNIPTGSQLTAMPKSKK